MSEQKEEEKAYRSWFCVFNNPATHIPELQSKEPKQICEMLAARWCISDTRSGAWVYCISAAGLHHVHMVLEDTNKARFSAVKKAYDGAHIEPTQGLKSQVEDYIYKRGAFEEKGEQVLYIHTVGEIVGAQGRRSDLVQARELLDSGLSPQQIFRKNPNFYRISGYIERMAYDKRVAETPVIRENVVYWHVGTTGTGKSFEGFRRMAERGRSAVYITAGENRHPFDRYTGQPEIWIDELRQDAPFFSFARLLGVCDKYTADVDARYQDTLMMWKETHITTPMMPQDLYDNIRQKQDKLNQLLRRIRYYVYHWRDSDGYHAYFHDTGCTGQTVDIRILQADALRWLARQKKTPEPGATDTGDVLEGFETLPTNECDWI